MKSNPVDMIGKVPAISVSSENFKPVTPGSSSRSCILQIIVSPLSESMHGESTYPAINLCVCRLLPMPGWACLIVTNRNSISFPDGYIRSEPTVYECELVVFDKHNRCVLTDGSYEISVHEKHNATVKTFSPKKHLTWEQIPETCLDEFSKSENPINGFNQKPTLEFRLSWTKDKSNDMVDRPLPITIRKDDNFIANKENEPDQNQNKFSNNMENGGPLALTALGPRTNTLNNSTAVIKL